MEGLIPMFYRAMKKSRIRSQYSVLSPEAEAAAAASASASYNIADFYMDPPSSHVFPNPKSFSTEGPRTHRRFNSFGGGSKAEDWRRSGAKSGHGAAQPQLVRFRSQRILSCLTGH